MLDTALTLLATDEERRRRMIAECTKPILQRYARTPGRTIIDTRWGEHTNGMPAFLIDVETHAKPTDPATGTMPTS